MFPFSWDITKKILHLFIYAGVDYIEGTWLKNKFPNQLQRDIDKNPSELAFEA